jgi:hypothetical protein
MAAPARAVRPTRRRSYQHHVAALLEEIDRRRHQLYLLRANGVLAAGLRDLKAELDAVRGELAAILAAGSR